MKYNSLGSVTHVTIPVPQRVRARQLVTSSFGQLSLAGVTRSSARARSVCKRLQVVNVWEERILEARPPSRERWMCSRTCGCAGTQGVWVYRFILFQWVSKRRPICGMFYRLADAELLSEGHRRRGTSKNCRRPSTHICL